MCGIVGIWNRDGRPVDVDALTRATTSIRHRGPDDEGYVLIDTRDGRVVPCGGAGTNPELDLPGIDSLRNDRFDLALGFRRLSILDLSPAGHQPMRSHDGRLWIVFNGEIYNYRELRDELRALGHDFRTGTDTEVILAAYTQWGESCVSRFNGMWAFALWDSTRRELFLSRDRFGIKPLLYTSRGATFAFASEQKAFITSALVPFAPRVDALVEFVALGRQTSARAGETFLENVVLLPPAHCAAVGRDKLDIRRYWSLPDPRRNGTVDGILIDEYREIFDSAVKLHLRADVPTGTALSGGLDSSSIVATADPFLDLTQETFSAVYDDAGPWNERRFIDSVIAKVGVHPNFVMPSAEGLWNDLGDLMWHHDEPINNTSVYAEWAVMRLVRERGIVVILNGQGADEIFGGYTPIFNAAMRQAILRGHLLAAWRNAAFVDNGSVNPTKLLASEVARSVVRAIAPAVPRRIHAQRVLQALQSSALNDGVVRGYLDRNGTGTAPKPFTSVRGQTLEWFEEYPLAHNLQWSDRNSMAFSVESRVPFLDYRLVEFVFSHGEDLLLRDGWSKWIHRKAMNGRLPDDVTWRRDKIGFATPEMRWMAESTVPLQRHFAEASAVERELFDVARLGNSNDAALQWRQAAATAWLRRFASAHREATT